jgi:DNA polymerase III subunit alpha
LASYIELHAHSEHSISEGLLRLDAYLDRVAASGVPAVALTDLDNVYAIVDFYQKSVKRGLKPLMGVDVLLHDVDCARPIQCVIFFKNKKGFSKTSAWLTKGYLDENRAGRPYLHAKDLFALSADDVIVLALPYAQPSIDDLDDSAALPGLLAFFKRASDYFGDAFYMAIRRIGRASEDALHEAVLPYAVAHKIPLVAVNSVCFLDASDARAHEARVCIDRGDVLEDPNRLRAYEVAQHLKSPETMAALFSDIPEALANTVHIAERLNYQVDFDQRHLPDFPLPDGMSLDELFREKSASGLKDRLAILMLARPDLEVAPYEARLKEEMDIITSMGFPGYFLIVADLINWSKNQGIPVGPGRGSGAGSLVAYALGITELDPIHYNLLFERFLNPERVSMPDFDIDFCMDQRDRVLQYVMARYGHDHVAQIATFGTMAAKAVLRDAGRVLGHPYGFVDALAKLVPFALGMTLKLALEEEPRLAARYANEPDVATLLDLASELEGLVRNVGKHAGGVVIGPTPLVDYTPVLFEPGATQGVTQLDKDAVEAIGLVKFDFLGLRTLTILDWTLQSVARLTGTKLDLNRLPLDDPKTFSLLHSCQTSAVFQLESQGMKSLVRKLKPDCFDDVVALVALFRPGPLQSGMVDDFVDRKHGRQAVAFLHPDLKPYLDSTYGVILYQEQVMYIARVLGGYTLGGADLLRRAMGKKKPEVMAKQRDIFVSGCLEKSIDRDLAEHIFDLMEKFSAYAFPKAHSVAYALLSYQTAYLKAHYPAAFMASVLSSECDNTDKLKELIAEAKRMNLSVLPPNIQTDQLHFWVNDAGEVYYALSAIKGMGIALVERIESVRASGGPFSDLFSFCHRVGASALSRKHLEVLIASGAMDCFDQSRAVLQASVDRALRYAQQKDAALASGQQDLLSMMGAVDSDAEALPEVDYAAAEDWDVLRRLGHEYDALGFYLSKHPMQIYQKELHSMGVRLLHTSSQPSKGNVLLSGFVKAVRMKTSKVGQRMAFVLMEDGLVELDVALYGDAFEQYGHYLKKNTVLIVLGRLEHDAYRGCLRLVARQLTDLDTLREKLAPALVVRLDEPTALSVLKQGFDEAQSGQSTVLLYYTTPEGETASVALPYRLSVDEGLLLSLKQLPGVTLLGLRYAQDASKRVVFD